MVHFLIEEDATMQSDENEIWKPIHGYEGLYEASNFGRIKSLERMVEKMYKGRSRKYLHKERVLTPTIVNGYYHVTLCKNDGLKNHQKFLLHRLVASSFYDNPLKKPQINHKNGIKTDNYIDNLEWATHGENIRHAVNTGLKIAPRGVNSTCSIPISQFTLNGIFVRHWAGASEVQRELGYFQSNISHCVRGLKKHAHGFIWKRQSQ